MPTLCLHDRTRIAAALRRNPYLHLYALGDMDEFQWPYTQWYGLAEGENIQEVILLYTAFETPVLQALTDNPSAMRALAQSVLHLLPRKIYAHLSEGVPDAFAADYHIHEQGMHYKMALRQPAQLGSVDTTSVIPLSESDVEDMKALYAVGNPIAWFDPRMIETGCYFGIREDGQLVSVAGVHVYSPEFQAAVLANVVTHPDFRGRGFAKMTSAQVCKTILQKIPTIGLNVHCDNPAAIHAYEQLGFERIGLYGEYDLELK